MATLIVCPVCETRYEVKAAFPPEGRKVRCSKCSHVWQATPVTAAAPKAAATPPRPPQAPPPQAAPAPQAPRPQAPPPPPPRAAPPPPPPPPPSMAPRPQGDADFETDSDLAAQVARMNAEAAPLAPEPAPAKQGGLFSRIMGKGAAEPSEPPPDMAPPPPPPTFSDTAQQDASFDVDYGGEEEQDPALADPALVAAAFGEAPPKERKAGKRMPVVAIGWGILAVLVALVAGIFFLAPNMTVSMLPGAARIYSLIGMPVGAQGLAFEGVRYGWTNDGSQTVLEVQGSVRNTSSTTMAVPTVIIALRDEKGEEISEWTTEVGAAQLAAGEEAPFLRQIPSPPSNVRSLKVRFAKAN